MAVPHTPEWDAEDKGPSSLVIIISVTVLSTLFAAARIFVRGKIRGKLQLDDYLIMASVVSLDIVLGESLSSCYQHDKNGRSNALTMPLQRPGLQLGKRWNGHRRSAIRKRPSLRNPLPRTATEGHLLDHRRLPRRRHVLLPPQGGRRRPPHPNSQPDIVA